MQMIRNITLMMVAGESVKRCRNKLGPKETILPTDLRSLFRQTDIRDLPLRQMHAVMGMRFWIICRKVGRDATGDLALRFRSVAAARTFIDLAEAVGEVWPQNFAIMRPCCAAVGVDEMTLSDMIAAANRADRRTFDTILIEMMPIAARDGLFELSVRFAGELTPILADSRSATGSGGI